MSPRSTTRSDNSQHVVVVGGGVAGMVTTIRLRERGYTVTLLEASQRPGGRIQTMRGFADDLYAEGGATFIPGVHELTNEYLERYDVELISIPENNLFTWWNINGQFSRFGANDEAWAVTLPDAERKIGLEGMIARYVGEAAHSIDDPRSSGWPSGKANRYDGVSYFDFLKKQGASDGAISLIRRIFPDIHGEGIEDVSALFCLRDFHNEGGGWSLIKGGSETFTNRMAAEVGSDMLFGACVTHIDHCCTSATVHFVQGTQKRVLQADKVVLAAQFSALNMIRFTPRLSPSKVSAMSQLGHSSVSRVLLQMKTRYWGDCGPGFMGITDTPSLGIRDASYHLPGERGIIECYIPGPAGRQIAAMSHDAQIATALEYVESVLPGAHDNIEFGMSKCWDTDPFIRGGYAYYRPGEMTALMPAVAVPDGVFHFAGDHASPWPSWIQGAIHSAHRVVHEIDQARS